MSLIIDVDNHDGPLSTEDIRQLLQAGMQGAIVGLQYPGNPYPPGVAHQQLEALINAGVPIVGCYAESQHIRDAWPNVAQFAAHIPQIYVACEEPHVDRAWIDSNLDFIDALNLGTRAGIYTGGWWWNAQPDNVKHWFGDRDLWAAVYDGNPDPDIFGAPIGDWNGCKIKQWSGHALVGRLNLDLNTDRTWGGS